jgi:hypothetical protein
MESKALKVECECGTSVMGHFAQIEGQAAELRAMLEEQGVTFEDEEEIPEHDCHLSAEDGCDCQREINGY